MYEYNGLMHCICYDFVTWIFGDHLRYAYVFAALFLMIGMNWNVF